MPEPRRQVNLGDLTTWIGRVDFLDPDVPLVGEIDSDLFHIAPLDAESDEEREVRLKAAGFEVERFKESEVWYHGRDVVDRWREARQNASQRRPRR